MLSRLPVLAVACAIGASTIGSSTLALAQTSPGQTPAMRAAEAGTHFKRAIELYGEADYTAALIEFRRAYELDPRFQALYNIGETYFQLQDYANALQTLDKYLRDGGAQVPPARREEVIREIEKLRTRVATIEITVNLPDADVTVDDVSVGKTPLAPVVVSAGRRRISVSKAGKPAATQVLELAGGDHKKLTITLSDDATPGPVGPVVTPVAESSSSTVQIVVPWVVTGVLAAAGAVTGVLALSSASDTKNDLKVYPNADPSAISSAHSKTFALGVTTDCLLGAAIVAAGFSIYFTATAGGSSSDRGPRTSLFRPPASSTASARPSLSLSIGAERATLRGTF